MSMMDYWIGVTGRASQPGSPDLCGVATRSTATSVSSWKTMQMRPPADRFHFHHGIYTSNPSLRLVSFSADLINTEI